MISYGFVRKLGCALALQAAVFTAAAHAQSLVIEGARGWLYPGWESLTEDNRAGVDHTVKLIANAGSAIADAKIELFVVVVPMKAAIYPEYLPAGEKLSAPVQNRYAYILKALGEHHVRTVDLGPVLIGVKAHHKAFYRTDYHWTPWSSQSAAHLIANLINPDAARQSDLRDHKAEHWREEKRYGDLASFLPRERRKHIGEEAFAVRDDAKKGGLLDEAHVAIQVVGNSFVQPSLSFPQALGISTRMPVGLSWNYGSVGPWLTLLQYLESDAFKQSRPRVILWQWNEAQFANGPDAAGQWAKESIMPPQVWLNRLRRDLAQ